MKKITQIKQAILEGDTATAMLLLDELEQYCAQQYTQGFRDAIKSNAHSITKT